MLNYLYTFYGKRAIVGMAMLVSGFTLKAAEIGVRLIDPPESGNVSLVLFDSPNAFGDLRDPVKVVVHEIDGRDRYRIENIPEGEYALMVYYDENQNGKMDENFIGVPKEPLGFSNNYRPKGPPSYSRAAFTISGTEELNFDMELYRPLGKRGRVGLGLGVIARGSPYRDYDGGVFRIIPAITYNGERLQVFGPNLQFGIAGSGGLRLAAIASYRIGVYEEDESDYLEGMGDRDDTLMAGLAVQAELPGGFDLSLSYQHDVLDTIGGGEARLALDKSVLVGGFRITPEVGINWLGKDLANHDFGVPVKKATGNRPAYDLDSSISYDVGVGAFRELNRNWIILGQVAVEFFDGDIKDSPIVEDGSVLKGFLAVNYLF